MSLAVVVGLIFGLLPLARAPRAGIVAALALAALSAFTAVSVEWADDNGRAFADAVRTGGYAALFTLVVLVSPRGSAKAWVAGLALGLVGVSVLALGTRFFPEIAPDQDLPRFLPSVAARLSYPVNYWNGLGAMMAFAIVALAWLSATAARRRHRAAAVSAIPLPALALFLTSSRGAVVAVVVGAGALLLLSPARLRILGGIALGAVVSAGLIALATSQDAFVDADLDAASAAGEGALMLGATVVAALVAGSLRLMVDRPLARLLIPERAAAVALAALVGLAAVGIVAADPGERLDRLSEAPSAPPQDQSGFVARHISSSEGTGRAQFWETGLDAFADRPVAGIGAGGYEAYWAEHGSFAYFVRDAHSLYVETLAELGAVGLLLLLGFFSAVLVRGVRLFRGVDRRLAAGPLALLACGAVSAGIDWTWELPAAFAPVVVAAALLAGPALRPGDERGGSHYPVGIAAIVAAWGLIVASGLVFVTQAKIDDSKAAVDRGDLADARADARAAASVQPWSPAPHVQLALVEERRGDLVAARQAIDEALAYDHSDFLLWLTSARLAEKTGDARRARGDIERARRLSPRSPLFEEGD